MKKKFASSKSTMDQISLRYARLQDKGILINDIDFSQTVTIDNIVNRDLSQTIGQSLLTFGRIVKIHKLGKLLFAQLRYDYFELEIVLSSHHTVNFEKTQQELRLGDIVLVNGIIDRSKREKCQIIVNRINVIVPCLVSHFPKISDRKRIHVGMTNDLQIVKKQKIRSHLLLSLRNFLHKEGFEEQYTPIMTKRFYGGRSHPFKSYNRHENREMYLRVTAEIAMRMLLAGGLHRIYEIGPSFRNETRDSLHISPFMLLEAYAPFCSFEKMLLLCENLLMNSTVEIFNQFGDHLEVQRILRNNQEHFIRVTCDSILMNMLGVDITLQEDLEKLAKLCNNERFTEADQKTPIVYKALKNLVFPKLQHPTIVTDLPSGLSPFIRNKLNDPAKLNRAYYILNGVQVAEVFEGQTNALNFLEALEIQSSSQVGDTHEDYIDVIHSFLFGMPPMSIMDISVDRFLMILLNETDVRNAVIEL